MIAAQFPTIETDSASTDEFLQNIGLSSTIFERAAEAVCGVVHNENPNFDIADLVLSIRNNAAFRALTEAGAEYNIFQKRSAGGKSYITDLDDTLKIMVHNSDAATALGNHIPAFASKRVRSGTSYVHSEAQGELDLGDPVIELEPAAPVSTQTTIDVCIFAEKIDGSISCRIELLVDAELTERGDAFKRCKRRFGMTFKSSDFVALSESKDVSGDDFSAIVSPKTGI